jgi:hypothetical protein
VPATIIRTAVPRPQGHQRLRRVESVVVAPRSISRHTSRAVNTGRADRAESVDGRALRSSAGPDLSSRRCAPREDPPTGARDLVRTGTLSEARPGMIGEARSSTVALFATSQARASAQSAIGARRADLIAVGIAACLPHTVGVGHTLSWLKSSLRNLAKVKRKLRAADLRWGRSIPDRLPRGRTPF